MHPKHAKVVNRPPMFHRIWRYAPAADATSAQHKVR